MSSTYIEPGEEWFYPFMSGGHWACCDCGLVHNIEFQVIQVINEPPAGPNRAVVLMDTRFRVGMRVQRNNRAPSQIRRHLNNIILEP